MTKNYLKKMPGTLRLSSDYLVICEHSMFSCCKYCAEEYVNIVQMDSEYYWMKDEKEKKEFIRFYKLEMVGA